MTFFYSAMYTESLFLFLSLAAFLAARQRNWLAAGCAGGLLTATRGNALVILLPLVWEAVLESQTPRDAQGAAVNRNSRWWLMLVPAGLVGYAGYLHFQFGDALAFARALTAWDRAIAFPWTGIQDALGYPIGYGRLLIGFALAGVLLCFLGLWMRLRASYQLYAAVTCLLYLSSSILHSLPRYLSVIFPFYIALAVASRRSESIYAVSLATSALLLALCLTLFVCGYLMI